MKKFFVFLSFIMMCSGCAAAESVVFIDGNGVVQRQIFTAPTTFNTSGQVIATATPQSVTVIRDTPVVQNSYYYDNTTPGEVLAAGITTALVGGLIYHGFKHHDRPRKHRPPHFGRPGGRHHGGGKRPGKGPGKGHRPSRR